MSVSKKRQQAIEPIVEALNLLNQAWFYIRSEEFSQEEILDLFYLSRDTSNLIKNLKSKKKKITYHPRKPKTEENQNA